MKNLLFCFLFLSSIGLFSQTDLRPYDFGQIQDKITTLAQDKPTIVNFWATWCVPCVEELPLFEKIAENSDYNLVMVSLDFVSMIDKKLVPFLKDNSLADNVLVWDQKNANEYIPKVDETWSGAIPATWLVTKNGEKFHEGKFETYDDLVGFIKN